MVLAREGRRIPVMRALSLPMALGLGCFGLLFLTPQTSEAFGRRGCSGGYVGAAYYDAGPAAYSPMYYPGYAYGGARYSGPMYGQPYYGAPRGPARPTTVVSVAMADDNFQPAALNVLPGTTVRWANNGQHVHTLTSKDGRWDSGDIPPGGAYSATFQYPGTYYYYCRHHKGMEGTIVVGSGGAGGAAAPRY